MNVYQSPLQLIGNTPLLQLKRLATNKNARVYMKLEMFNLTGSVKDRAAKYLIESAEKKGLINSGTTIVESTSGNLGLALAAICAYKNYRLICVVDPKIETTKLTALKAFGADICMESLPTGVASLPP